MFKKIIAALVFITLIQNIYAQDIASPFEWLTNTISRNDSIVVDYLNTIDFGERIRAIPYIAKRDDRNFSLLLDNIYYQRGNNVHENEFILFLMLDHFFNDEESVNASRESFLAILKNISNYQSSTLRKIIMEKTALLDNRNAETVLLRHALFLLEEGQRNRGRFSPAMLEESRIFFIYSAKVNSPVLNDYRQEIYVTVSNIPDSFRN
ncbi:MAG: hypothetical protein FWC36_09010 [Spirochaetes bacterium]|nr:hypothetical protein [Spirochaetota bacterium]